MLTTLLVIVIHATLLLGLPQLSSSKLPARDAGTFVIRQVAPPALAPTADPPKPVTAPESRRKPDPTTARRPATPQPRDQVKPKPAAPQASETGPSPQSTLGGAHAAPTMFTPIPLGAFGGTLPPAPIMPPITAEKQAAVLEVMAQDGKEAPIRIPRATDLNYETSGTIDGKDFSGTTPAKWRQDGQWYEIRWDFYNPKVGEQSRRVVGLITPQGLAPLRAVSRTPDPQEIQFDYDARKTWFSAAGADASLVSGAEDRLSAVIQLGALLAGDPERYPVGTAIELPAAHIRGAGMWRFLVERDENVQALGDQSVPAIYLVHEPLDPRDARIEMWLSPALDYLPVRLRTTEPTGDRVVYNLVSAYAQPTPSSGPASARSP